MLKVTRCTCIQRIVRNGLPGTRKCTGILNPALWHGKRILVCDYCGRLYPEHYQDRCIETICRRCGYVF